MKNKSKCMCGRRYCQGFYTLHQKELYKIDKIKETKLAEMPTARFIIDPSPTSGEIAVEFYDVHIINDPNTPKEEIGSVVFTKLTNEEARKRVRLAEAYEKVMLDFIKRKKEEEINAV